MGNKSQNISFEEEQDIDKIKLSYLNYKENFSYMENFSYIYEKYITLNIRLHSIFSLRFQAIFDEKYLKAIKEKLKLFDGDEENEEIKKMKKILLECENIRKKAFNDSIFNDNLLLNMKINYEKNSITKESYQKMSEDVINSEIDTLIKYEKQLFIKRDEIIQLGVII